METAMADTDRPARADDDATSHAGSDATSQATSHAGAVTTISQWLRDGERALVARGVTSARLDARRLVEAVTGKSAAQIIADPEILLTDHQLVQLQSFLDRRSNHEPVSRILGQREFYGRTFKVTPATLDPRPDSETLIDAALDLARRENWFDRALRIIDVGTGSGCLLLTLLAELPEATGLGTDISPDALEVAEQNAQSLGLSGRVKFVQRRSLGGVNEEFDLLISNPPYIPSREIAGLAPDVRRYDPLAALDGGDDGLLVYRELTPALCQVIPAGYALFEVGAGQASEVRDIMVSGCSRHRSENRLNLYDFGGHERVVALAPCNGGK